MAIQAYKTFIAGEILTASDLNSSFTQVFSNGEDLGWPATKAKALAGNSLTLDSDGNTHFTADTNNLLDLAISGTDLYDWDGTVTSPVNGLKFTATATGVSTKITAKSATDTNIDIDIVPKGTGRLTENAVNVILEDTGNHILAVQFYS